MGDWTCTEAFITHPNGANGLELYAHLVNVETQESSKLQISIIEPEGRKSYNAARADVLGVMLAAAIRQLSGRFVVL